MTPYDASNLAGPAASPVAQPIQAAVPGYMRDVYDWAYLKPRNVRILDRELVVSLILWGNSGRLQRALLGEINPGASVLQAAHVYGDLIPGIAASLNHPGQLEVVEVAPVQAERCRKKLRSHPETVITLGDVADLDASPRDLVSCFFLLHEIPTEYKRAVVNTLLSHVAEGGKAVFIDYHRPHWLHPLKPLMMVIFETLEPFARELLDHDIVEYADDADAFSWRKETYFGGLYQKTVAERR